MIKLLNNQLILIFLLVSTICSAKEEILFTVNNNPVTTIDLTQRVNYLSFLNNLDINNIDKNEYIDDLISVKLFDEFFLREGQNIQQEEIYNFFDAILINNQNEFEKLFKKNELTKEIILNNIRYDLQRKKTIESLLKKRINDINFSENIHNIIDIYNLKLNYFIIPKKYKEKIINIYNDLLKKGFNTIKDFLNNSEIPYEFYSREIINLDQINNKIKKIILNNENSFFIDESNYFMMGIIEKKLKEDIDLKYSFIQIKTKKNVSFEMITNELIDCSNIENMESDNRLEIKEYKSIHLKKLNINIFQNLLKQNDRIIITNNNQKFLILLCDIDYNKEITQDKFIYNKIQKLAKEIENEFLIIKKKEFNFQTFIESN